MTGAADDDPSGIATYSQAGAQFGVHTLWTVVLIYPFMAVFQSLCARVGRVTGRGLATNIKAAFPPSVLRVVVLSLLVANVLNIAADVAAMGEAAALATGGGRHVFTVALALLSLALQVFAPYRRYVHFLKWLTLALLAYVGVVLTVHAPLREVAVRTLFPHFPINADAATMIVAVFGTTISPYLFFWQASEEVEDIAGRPGARPLLDAPDEAPAELRRIGWDTYLGMGYSNAIAYCIMLSTALTLHDAGAGEIQTAAQAASALRPIAGDFAFGLFAAGIVGSGLLAVPTLAGSAAYALAEAMGWREGLAAKFNEARGFYAVIGFAILAGVALDYSPVDPMKALFWSAVVNGVVAAPLMTVVMLLASNGRIMGEFTANAWQRVAGWMATAIMTAVSVAMFALA